MKKTANLSGRNTAVLEFEALPINITPAEAGVNKFFIDFFTYPFR